MASQSNLKRFRPKSSWVWTYFDISENDSCLTVCRIWSAELPYTSATSSMSSHLHAKHNIQKDKDLETQSNLGGNNMDSDEEVDASNNKVTARKKIKLDNVIVDFIAQTDQSISIIEHPSFLKLVNIYL